MRSIVIEGFELLYQDNNYSIDDVSGTFTEASVEFYLNKYPKECIFVIYADLYSLDLSKIWWEEEIRKNLHKVRRFLELKRGDFI